MACAPAAAALRRMLPRLPGSRTSSVIKAKSSGVGIGWVDCRTTTRIPWGVWVSLAVFITARWMGLAEVPASVAMIYGSCATATSSYALARQMGGDAPLAAAIVTLQTLASFITIPVAILVTRYAFA